MFDIDATFRQRLPVAVNQTSFDCMITLVWAISTLDRILLRFLRTGFPGFWPSLKCKKGTNRLRFTYITMCTYVWWIKWQMFQSRLYVLVYKYILFEKDITFQASTYINRFSLELNVSWVNVFIIYYKILIASYDMKTRRWLATSYIEMYLKHFLCYKSNIFMV